MQVGFVLVIKIAGHITIGSWTAKAIRSMRKGVPDAGASSIQIVSSFNLVSGCCRSPDKIGAELVTRKSSHAKRSYG